jgi:hypothetical protein
MPVALHNIRDLLLPGLQAMHIRMTAEDAELFERYKHLFAGNPIATKPSDPLFTLDQIHEAQALCESLAASRSPPTTTPNGSDNA